MTILGNIGIGAVRMPAGRAILSCVVLAMAHSAPLQAAEELLTGRLSIMWVDPDPESGSYP